MNGDVGWSLGEEFHARLNLPTFCFEQQHIFYSSAAVRSIRRVLLDFFRLLIFLLLFFLALSFSFLSSIGVLLISLQLSATQYDKATFNRTPDEYPTVFLYQLQQMIHF